MRHILKLYRPLSETIPLLKTVENISITTFDPISDKNEWLVFNNEVFANHADQGNWISLDLEHRIVEPWFDAQGFFLAKKDSKIVGCCWTKIHENCVNEGPVGELYVVGVSRENIGQGIGKALSITALEYLKGKKIKQAMLYVDADNEAGIALYTHLGFA